MPANKQAAAQDYEPDRTRPLLMPPATGAPSESVDSKATANTRDMLLGTILAERYEIESVIASGGMSIVYRARHSTIKCKVAVKVLHPQLELTDQLVSRFYKEGRAVSALDQANIVCIHDFGETPDGRPFMVMDFLDGITLADALDEGKPLALGRALDIFVQCCDALEHAHNKGVVHRDLKPSNIMLIKRDDQGDLVKLVDFGIAKVHHAQAEDEQKLTKTGEVFGSPLYMSPEQCLGRTLDARSDIYSLGCVIYEALTGTVPYPGATVYDTITMHLGSTPKSIGSLNADLRDRRRLDAVVLKCLAKAPCDRYQTASQLKSDLQKLQSNEKESWAAALATGIKIWYLLKRSSGMRQKLHLPTVTALSILTTGALAAAWMLAAFMLTPVSNQAQPEMAAKPLPAPPSPAIEQADYRTREWRAKRWLSFSEYRRGEYSPELLPALSRLSSFYKQHSEYSKAIPLYLRMLSISQRLPQAVAKDQMAAVLDGLGNCYYHLGHLPEAATCYAQAMDILSCLPAPEAKRQIEALSHLADIHYRNGQYPQASAILLHIDHLYNDNPALREELSYPEFLLRFADILRLTREGTRAEATYQKALRDLHARSKAPLEDLVAADYGLALVLEQSGALEEAKERLKLAINVADKAGGDQHLLARLHDKAAQLSWQMGRYPEALYHRFLTRWCEKRAAQGEKS